MRGAGPGWTPNHPPRPSSCIDSTMPINPTSISPPFTCLRSLLLAVGRSASLRVAVDFQGGLAK